MSKNKRVPDILDTQSRTREKFWKGPFSTNVAGREILKRVLPVLEDNIRFALTAHSATAPTRGLEQVLRRLAPDQLAAIALRTLLNQVYATRGLGPARGTKKQTRRRRPPNRPMLLRIALGRILRDELEFAGLYATQDWLLAEGTPSKKRGVNPQQATKAKHKWLGKFRRIHWNDAECAQAGDWLIGISHLDDLVVEDGRGGLELADEVQAAFDVLVEDLIFTHPLYAPSLKEPSPWTGWRAQFDGRISATFIKTDHPETVEAVKTAFDDGSIGPHAMGVSAVQRVPLKINSVTLPLVEKFAGDEYKRDTDLAGALLAEGNCFWNPIRCTFGGRLIPLCDLNYNRGDPVRSLFMFAKGRPIGNNIHWLEIAVANSFGGIKGHWVERQNWVIENREYVKAVADDPGLLWRDLNERGKPKASEPFQFAAACAEYISADTHGPTYETHLPIWLDASANGIQHLAMMGRDPELAAMVNIKTAPVRSSDIGICPMTGAFKLDIRPSSSHIWDVEPDDLQDAYDIVGRHAISLLLADRADPFSQFWLDHQKHLRTLLKQPVMTLPYGVTSGGMRDQIRDGVKDLELELPPAVRWKDDAGKPRHRDATEKLRDIAWRSIEEKLPGALKVREYVQAIAQHMLEPGREKFLSPTGRIMYRFRAPPAQFMTWVTPSGVPVSNRSLYSETKRVRLPFLGESPKIADGYTDIANRHGVKGGAVANFVHSMDASHLTLSVNAAVAVGITNIMTVHDCFATLAPDTRLFSKIRRGVLASMYMDSPLDRLWERNTVPGSGGVPRLQLGTLNPQFVAFSEYFDR